MRTRRPSKPLIRGLLAAGGCLAVAGVFAQPQDRAMARLENQRQLSAASAARKSGAQQKALSRGWVLEATGKDGQRFELVDIGPTGLPLYNETLTTNANIGVNGLELHSDTPSVTGASVTVGVWDAGSVRNTHIEFDGGARCTNEDAAPAISNHATAVTGVIISAGLNTGVIGVAKGATAECYDWNNNIAEMLSRVPLSPVDTDAVPISNHSYGFLHGWNWGTQSGNLGWHWFGETWKPDGTGDREDPKFGLYTTFSAQLDQLSHDNPWHLVFWAAGNDRDDTYTHPRDGTGTLYYYDTDIDDWAEAFWEVATAPFDETTGEGGYDTTITRACAKNVIAVGALTDAVTAGVRDPSAATPTAFSGWGPADDGRVKPDLVANGHQLLLTVAGSDDMTYGTGLGSGTSFSSPNAAGAGALIVDYAQTHLPGWLPRASTVKCLLIHGATDMGNAGPDYIYGWGLPDTVASVEPIKRQADPGTASAHCVVEGLLDGDTPIGGDTYNISWDGAEDLKVTLSWTDPPATSPGIVLDDRTPLLVNDLDLRVTGPDGTSLPSVLDPANPTALATAGDNIVDTVEQIIVSPGATSGAFTVTVSMKGAVPSEGQWYSLAISGHQPAAPGPSPLSASSASPDWALVASTNDLDIEGFGFHPGTQIHLQKSGEPDAQLAGEYGSPTKLRAILDTTGLALGVWDIIVTRPDGESVTMAGALTIGDGSSIKDWRVLE